ncbi:DNA gyrase subunit B [bacterium]|nr:DNA gyrase subunit B [bacterium]
MTMSNYTSEQLQILEGLEAVRKRPGMYIGSTGQPGLHHLITEIINNSMDEALAGYATHIKLVFYKNGSVAIFDNGRGIPFDMNSKYGKTGLEIAFTVLHGGGKFGGGGYKVSSGLHGVGASVVNALSEYCRVISRRGSEIVIQEYKEGGKVLGPVRPFKKSETLLSDIEIPMDTEGWNYPSGTIVQFKPDKTIFDTTDFKYEFFENQLREYAYLTAKVKFEIEDQRSSKKYVYYFEGGVKTFLRNLNKGKKVVNSPFYVSKETDEITVEAAFQYNDTYNENFLSFANHIKTGEGGTHLTGFKTALTRTINEYAKKQNYLKDAESLTPDDINEGLTAVISVKLQSEELQFEGQTKNKLGNTFVRPLVEQITKVALTDFFEENPKEAKAILEKNILAMKARMAAKAARETVIRKSALEGGGVLPGKLTDCSEKDNTKTEIFIVEGDSAGGSAKDGRDRKIQAVLPIFGKINNTEGERLEKIVTSEKFKNLIIAIGAGIGDLYNPEKLRYGKIIIMSDADIDGSHIMTLYLTFFFRHMRPLIENGHIYVAVPPLYKASWGKNKKYLFTDSERDKFMKENSDKKIITQRFKGLGEMNSEELWETTMNPKTRRLKQVTVSDASRADQVFTVLMGDEVLPRKKFIQTNAKKANIDVAG